jgi:dipeptidyl aminopeptidase/acylaminoacyl peptidase
VRFIRAFFLHSLAAAALLSTLPASALAQAQRMDELLKQLDRTTSFSDPSISPDGQWITWTENALGNARHTYILSRSAPEAKPLPITPPGMSQPCECHGFAWSRDSREVAFFADGQGSETQIFVYAPGNKRYRKIANLRGYARDLSWSPDDKQIALLYAEGGGGGGPLEAEPAAVGEIGGEMHNQRLSFVNAASGGTLTPLTPANLNIYEYDWAPDQKEFAAIAAPGPADNNWWIAKLYRVDAASGEMKLLFSPPAEQQIADPRWSPDGSSIALIAGLMSDEGFTGGDILLLGRDGGTPHNLTTGAHLSASSLKWTQAQELLVTMDVDGGSAIANLSVPGGSMQTLWHGPNVLHADGNYPDFAVAQDGRTAIAIESTWQQPPEVWAGPIGNWQRMTRANENQNAHWGKAESIHWNSGNFTVQGWLLYPEDFNPSRRYPMVVEVHGGPANQRSSAWPSSNFDMSVLAGMGYFVFFPNPRGSYGEGEAFTRANVKDFGGGDLRDILAGLDAVTAKVPVEEQRIGITGWSYGGFMTMWTVTQTHRFHAAVAGAGIADWLSYYGENSIDEWMIPYFGASVYDDPAVYSKSSPIDYIKSVKTPTLVLVGERDGECPAPQSFEFWHALETLKVPTTLVVYAGEGHGFHDEKDKMDRMRRTLAWFNQYLGSK